MDALSFRAREIEELADVYFFRPLGAICARAARAIHTTPTQLTIFSMFVGIFGGALLYNVQRSLLGFAVLIFYSVLDSSDGQLARMTNRVTELGRVLDGVIGYVVYAAIYISITSGLLARGGNNSIFFWAALAIISNIAQAQMYEYHRYHYASIVVNGHVPGNDPRKVSSKAVALAFRLYLATQRLLIGEHFAVEAKIVARARGDHVRDEDRERYRRLFYRPVRGWNLLGDNTRFYAIGLAAMLHRMDLFFAFIVVPMNVALIFLWLWQRRADRRFLATI